MESKQSIAKVAWTDLAKEVMHGDVLRDTAVAIPFGLLQRSVKGKPEQQLSYSAHCMLVKMHDFLHAAYRNV